jgi:tetratricopeptide (TPR) repeat protein
VKSVLVALAAALALPSHARPDDSITALMQREHWKEARAAVDALARSSPDDARTVYLQSRVKLAFHQRDQALALAERAVELDPRNADYHFQLADVCGALTEGAGMVKAMGLARRLRKEAEQALALDPRHVDACWTLMEFYARAPRVIGGDNKKAGVLAAQILQLDPVRGCLAQAELALRAKNESQAESLFQRAAATQPPDYSAQIALARFFASDSRKRWDLAERYGRAAIAADPGRVGGHILLAAVYAHLERWNDLDEALAEAERQVPDNLSPYYQAARALIVDGKELPRAVVYLRRYLTVEPEGGGNPTWAHAHWRLALALEKQGKRPDALAELETALQLDPDLDQAKKDLRRLKRG